MRQTTEFKLGETPPDEQYLLDACVTLRNLVAVTKALLLSYRTAASESQWRCVHCQGVWSTPLGSEEQHKDFCPVPAAVAILKAAEEFC